MEGWGLPFFGGAPLGDKKQFLEKTILHPVSFIPCDVQTFSPAAGHILAHSFVSPAEIILNAL